MSESPLEGEVVDHRCHLTLTPAEAEALYRWMESDDSSPWWESPLAVIWPAIRDYVRYDAPWTTDVSASSPPRPDRPPATAS